MSGLVRITDLALLFLLVLFTDRLMALFFLIPGKASGSLADCPSPDVENRIRTEDASVCVALLQFLLLLGGLELATPVRMNLHVRLVLLENVELGFPLAEEAGLLVRAHVQTILVRYVDGAVVLLLVVQADARTSPHDSIDLVLHVGFVVVHRYGLLE